MTAPSHPALLPGSPPPGASEDVDFILRAVPELAFFPELEPAIPAVSSAVWPPGPDALARIDEHDFRADLLSGLQALSQRAERERSGGLAFLVRTLTYFLVGPAALPLAEHPLAVAVFLRGAARGRAELDVPREIARAMDRWS